MLTSSNLAGHTVEAKARVVDGWMSGRRRAGTRPEQIAASARTARRVKKSGRGHYARDIRRLLQCLILFPTLPTPQTRIAFFLFSCGRIEIDFGHCAGAIRSSALELECQLCKAYVTMLLSPLSTPFPRLFRTSPRLKVTHSQSTVCTTVSR